MSLSSYQSLSREIVDDFHQARRRAALREIVARFTGEPVGLLSYEEVRQKLRAKVSPRKTVEDIPIGSIIGSVGRYSDFTRDFLPRQDADAERWVRVKMAFSGPRDLPPIEVYRIGEAYFVSDGNHRVSVARQLGADYIQAHVTEVNVRVPITPDIKPEELIIKSETIDFLEETSLDELRPGADLQVTVAGQYELLKEHIQVHQYYMGIERKEEIPYAEAVAHWYDTVYLPIVRIIRERGLLRRFPGRTETDLYLWLSEHRAVIEKEVGWEVKPEAAASDLAAQPASQFQKITSWLGEKIRDTVFPTELGSGPPPGFWRQELVQGRPDDRLFLDILVLLNGKSGGWTALDQAILIARKENASLHGLHVVPEGERRDGSELQNIQQEFEQRCSSAGVAGNLQIAAGKIADLVSSQSRWVDLVVLNLEYPPGPRPIARLSSGISNLVRRCASPILFVPDKAVEITSALLAFDASPKAEEALFISAYLAGQWNADLSVTTVVNEEDAKAESLTRARVYLEEHRIKAEYEVATGPVGQSIVLSAEAHRSQIILMGGYGANPLLEVITGSTVDEVLRSSRRLTLICR